MVVAEQMQGGMYGQERKLALKRMTVFLRLCPGTLHGNNNVADGGRSICLVLRIRRKHKAVIEVILVFIQRE